MPEIPKKQFPSLDSFSPEEIPHLTGLGKHAGDSLYYIHPDKLKYLSPQQARDLRQYILNDLTIYDQRQDKWKEALKTVENIIDTNLKNVNIRKRRK